MTTSNPGFMKSYPRLHPSSYLYIDIHLASASIFIDKSMDNTHSQRPQWYFLLASAHAGSTPTDLWIRASTKSHQTTALQGPHLSTIYDAVASVVKLANRSQSGNGHYPCRQKAALQGPQLSPNHGGVVVSLVKNCIVLPEFADGTALAQEGIKPGGAHRDVGSSKIRSL